MLYGTKMTSASSSYFFHHFCYVGSHHLHGLFEVKFSFLSYLHRCFTVLEEIMVIFPRILKHEY